MNNWEDRVDNDMLMLKIQSANMDYEDTTRKCYLIYHFL